MGNRWQRDRLSRPREGEYEALAARQRGRSCGYPQGPRLSRDAVGAKVRKGVSSASTSSH